MGDGENAALVRVCCRPAADVVQQIAVFLQARCQWKTLLQQSVSIYMCAKRGGCILSLFFFFGFPFAFSEYTY